MNLSEIINSMTGKTPSDLKEMLLSQYSAMPPERLSEHVWNQQVMAKRNGQANEMNRWNVLAFRKFQ